MRNLLFCLCLLIWLNRAYADFSDSEVVSLIAARMQAYEDSNPGQAIVEWEQIEEVRTGIASVDSIVLNDDILNLYSFVAHLTSQPIVINYKRLVIVQNDPIDWPEESKINATDQQGVKIRFVVLRGDEGNYSSTWLSEDMVQTAFSDMGVPLSSLDTSKRISGRPLSFGQKIFSGWPFWICACALSWAIIRRVSLNSRNS